ncbi:MAG: hypothetical protein KJ067_11810 [Vicinamibacteria bacterium]|nr:hypothetical protein [Vicinamibacteria bacterium]
MRKGFVRGLQAAAFLVLAAAIAAPAWAQGLFYAEEKKDDRFYVFNTKKTWEAWKVSGEMGVAITRLGAGPDGATVVAENETALELFFFKYGIQEAVERPKSPTQRVEWRDGKTRITTDNAYLEISNRIQVRFTEELPDDSVQLAGTSAKGDAKPSFRLRRVKTKFEGWAFGKSWISYELQANWPAVSGSNAGAILEDANISIDLTKGKGRFRVIAGQFKVPFGHQEMTSSGSQSFVDRAEVSNQYARGRDTGVAVFGNLNNKIEYRVGVFNGNGLTRSANDNGNLQMNARVMWQPSGKVNLTQRAWISGAMYGEADFDSTDSPIFAVAANFEKNDFHGATTGNDLKDTIFGFDAIFKYKRFYATGEYYVRERTPESGAKFNSDGFFAQASYLLDKAKKWELAARIGQYDPTDAVDDNLRKEIRGALSYYYAKHALKLQADFGQLENEAANSGKGTKNKELRLQAQIIF